MKKILLAVVLAALLSGCTGEPSTTHEPSSGTGGPPPVTYDDK